MAKSTRFAVEGRGDFPFDMLRSDRCWPDHSADCLQMVGRNSRRTVWLRTEAPGGPTPAQWASFNWRVVEANPG